MTTDRMVYHLALTRAMLEGATIALLPGDPGRVEGIARTEPFVNARELANKREYRTWIAYVGTTPILVTSTGIGGPSASIAIDELAQIGITTFLRVGTTGAIQAHVDVGDVIVTTGAVRLDGASTHYAPIEYPAVAHPDVVSAAVAAARALDIPARIGVSASTDTFYPGAGACRLVHGIRAAALPGRHRGMAPAARPQLRDGSRDAAHDDGLHGAARRMRRRRGRQPDARRARGTRGAEARRAQRGAGGGARGRRPRALTVMWGCVNGRCRRGSRTTTIRQTTASTRVLS